MEYKGISFDAIVATPGCGKSYLCDKYPEKFVDADEVRLKCKYYVPENITRDELEQTKGDRTFERRCGHEEFIKNVYENLDKFVSEGKTLILAPHPEAIEYLISRNIKFAFVFPCKNMKEKLIERMQKRGNSQKFIDENANMFDEFYKQNKEENKSAVHYEFRKDEYLEDIVKKFGYKFWLKTYFKRN